MHISLKCPLLLAGAFIALIHMPSSCARSLPQQSAGDFTIAKTSYSLIDDKESFPKNNTSPLHIKRQKREEEKEMPFDFHTNHLPCDMDTPELTKYIGAMPTHCIWMYNNRYVKEAYFRNFKIYQLEGFFFGQFYERFKRFEMSPHSFT